MWDTSSWVGAEYTPWRASNELWWANYSSFRPDLQRELPAIKATLGFTALRVWLHSMLYAADSAGLKKSMGDFLDLAEANGLRVGFVFFDDCWNFNGANLSAPCVPRKGLHNGCWMASPQAAERTSIARFKPYVSDIVGSFRADPRVLWWEIYNEPKRRGPQSNFTLALRDAAFGWARAAHPTQPIASCWDDSKDTELVDRHQYMLPWGLNNPVFSDPAEGGFVTEAGARWYQKTRADAGSPLTVINWLTQLKKAAHAPPPPSGFRYEQGALARGDDRPSSPLLNTTLVAAKTACSADSGCAGLTYQGRKDAAGPIAKVYLKGKGDGMDPDGAWSTYYKPSPPPFIPGVMIDWEVCARAPANSTSTRARQQHIHERRLRRSRE